MIVCPNCNHPNPDGAVQCEACYTPLPVLSTCPNCRASIQADASFCGQCGFNLQDAASVAPSPSPDPDPGVPDLSPLEPLISPDPLMFPVEPEAESEAVPLPPPVPSIEPPESLVAEIVEPVASEPIAEPIAEPVASSPMPDPPSIAPVSPPPVAQFTQLQTQTARLLHVQTNLTLELPTNLSVIHIGKPNDRVPPDIDVSGFPNSEIVSRIHADIRVEADAYYIEDLGSSNGTYINNVPLPSGNRHRLRIGDRIALGKGDKVTFLFQA